MDNRTHFVVAASQFIVNDDALLIFESFDVLSHEQNAGDAQETTLAQWNEDGVMADFTFSIDNTKNVVIDSLSLSLVASDGTTTFNLDEITVNLAPNLGNPPTIDTDYTRGYILPSGAEFNLVKVEDGGTVTTKTFYDCVIGQKITWQEWIANANVPPVFIDLAQQNSGLNQKADNYSNENGYKIYLMVSATVTGDDSTQGNITKTYSQLSTEVNTYDYFESDDGVIVSGTVETFDNTDTYNLNGGFLENEETLFKTTWVGAAPLVLADVAYVIHRIERENALGQLEIEESSSLRGAVTGGKLETMTVVQSGNDIVSTCIIKAGALSGGNWKLSARIKTPAIPTAFAWILAHITNPNGLAVVFTSRVPMFANNKTFYSVNSATVEADYTFRIGDSTAALNDANDGGWAAFPTLTFAQFDTSTVDANDKVRIEYTGIVTDTDILTAVKVAVDENVIATVSNIVYAESRTAAGDVLLPFQTAHSVGIVTTTNTTTEFSEVRTDAEISASADLTDFTTGIGSLTGLGTDASGHLFARKDTSSGIGDISIQSTATTAADGAIVGIASPLQNFAYPVTGSGSNVQCFESDSINDQCYLTDATDYIWDNTLDFEAWSIGTKCSYFTSCFSNGVVAAAFFGAGAGSGFNRLTFYTHGVVVAGVGFGTVPTAKVGYYRTVFVVEKTAANRLNIKIYINGRLAFDQTQSYVVSTFNTIKTQYNSTNRITLDNPTNVASGAGEMTKRLHEIAVVFRAATDKEIREYSLGNLSFTPDLHWDFSSASGATIPELIGGYDSTLYNSTNLRTNLFV